MKGFRESSVWEYLDGDDVLLGHGSAALSGWPRSLDPVYPPTLNRILSGDNAIKISSLSSLLFDHSPPITKIQNIKGFVDTILATFLEQSFRTSKIRGNIEFPCRNIKIGGKFLFPYSLSPIGYEVPPHN
jgi:hypothetical protein